MATYSNINIKSSVGYTSYSHNINSFGSGWHAIYYTIHITLCRSIQKYMYIENLLAFSRMMSRRTSSSTTSSPPLVTSPSFMMVVSLPLQQSRCHYRETSISWQQYTSNVSRIAKHWLQQEPAESTGSYRVLSLLTWQDTCNLQIKQI